MSEKSLLIQIEKEQKQMVEKKFALEREKKEEQEKEAVLQSGKKINIFSSATFPRASTQILQEKKQEEKKIAQLESKVSQVIEKPNYDYIETLSNEEREKIFKIEKQEEAKPKVKFGKLKTIVISILFAIFGVWGIINVATLDSLSSNLTKIETVYQLNLVNYIKNLTTLDVANAENMSNLLPTIPEQSGEATDIGQQSNWFDRFCNFIAGLFGG